MAQFTVYKNINEATKDSVPYLVDVQNDILADLNTRVVIPMCSTSAFGNKPISNLSPSFEINGSSYILLTPQLAGIAISELGSPVCDLSEFRLQFINALDFLFTGF
ncbi:CcdB family protein [Patescibacteria group bacterium]|nr:CcdB family protein [Patescibacteria group bacterium]